MPGIAPDVATESVSFSGSTSGVGMFGMSTDELDQRMREGREQGGGFGGGGGPGGGGPGGGGPVAAVPVAAVPQVAASPVVGFGGFGGGGGRGGPMVLGGGRGRYDINRPHGSVYYSVGDSALDAAPYALTRQFEGFDRESQLPPAALRRLPGWAAEHSQNLQWRKQDFFLFELQRLARQFAL